MKLFLPLSLFFFCLFCSCGNQVHKVESYSLTKEDTIQCINLSSSCLDSIKNKNIDAALQLIHVVKNDTLYPLNQSQKDKLLSKFQLFPVLNYNLTALSFDESIGNSIKYRIEFAENAHTSIQFNLIRINGTWYLSINE